MTLWLAPPCGYRDAAAVGAGTAVLILCLFCIARLQERLGTVRAAVVHERRLVAERGAEIERLSVLAASAGTDEADAVREGRDLRDSLLAAFESVARTMHGMATVQQQVLGHVGARVEDPRLTDEIEHADHAAAQLTRKAQTLMVLCGMWPARRDSRPASVYDCVLGARARIIEFARVEVRGGRDSYVVASAAEGLTHSLAELLENATVFSPPRAEVTVSVRSGEGGVTVEIDDAGPGMPPDVLAGSAARLREKPDLAELGAVPRLGLACVGRWSRELGFGVELTESSARGGTRAEVLVPPRLLTRRPEPAGPATSGAQPDDVVHRAVEEENAVEQERTVESSPAAHGLRLRLRGPGRVPQPGPPTDAPPPDGTPRPDRTGDSP